MRENDLHIADDRRFAMSKVWAWICAILIALSIIGLMAYGRSERRAYWAARGVLLRQAAAEAAAQPVERSLFGHLSR
jgi:hypothetical protein